MTAALGIAHGGIKDVGGSFILEFVAPSVTFESRLDIWADDLRIELHSIGGPAHTTNDVVAWLPEEKVLYTGDLVFHGGTPFVLMGSVSGSFAAIDRMRAFEAEVIVPGHGPVCGTPPFEAACAADLGEFAVLTDSERLVGNLHRAMAELDGLPEGGRIDLGRAIADMVRCNSGDLLRCCA